MKVSIERLVQHVAHTQPVPAAVPEQHLVVSQPSPVPLHQQSPQEQDHIHPTPAAREDNMAMAMTGENSLEPVGPGSQGGSGDVEDGAVTVEEPMGSLYEVTRLRNIRSNQAKTARHATQGGKIDDFISRGVIPLAEAEELYKSFHATLNHYLWVGLEQTHPSFASVRQSSELLTATILAFAL